MITLSQLNMSWTVAPAKARRKSFLFVICPIETIVLVTEVPMLAPITIGMASCTVKTEMYNSRVKSGKFGHQVNSDTRLQTVEIQMRRLLMSRLIRIFTDCLVKLFFIPIIEL